MPFTVEEFFAVFARYNLAIWPLPVAMWVICAAISGLVILRWRGGSAAILLRVPQDFGLIAAGLIAVAFALAHWRHMDVARHGSEAAPQAGSIPSQARGNAGAGGT